MAETKFVHRVRSKVPDGQRVLEWEVGVDAKGDLVLCHEAKVMFRLRPDMSGQVNWVAPPGVTFNDGTIDFKVDPAHFA